MPQSHAHIICAEVYASVVAECIGRVHRQSVCVEWYVERCVERRAKRCAQCWSFTAQPVDLCAPGVWGIQASGGMAPTILA